MGKTLYIFLDEGGNFDFSPSGSSFFSVSSISALRPFGTHTILDTYKYDLIEYGLDIEYFHCSHDNKHVRKNIFKIINENIKDFRIDSLLIEKSKTGPALHDPKKFYPRMLGYLLRHVISEVVNEDVDEVVVITDQIPINKKRKAVEKSVKKVLSDMLSNDVSYRVIHHSSKAHYGLQIADYCNWAIWRKWEKEDDEYYLKIGNAIKSEYDIFRNGTRNYYKI